MKSIKFDNYEFIKNQIPHNQKYKPDQFNQNLFEWLKSLKTDNDAENPNGDCAESVQHHFEDRARIFGNGQSTQIENHDRQASQNKEKCALLKSKIINGRRGRVDRETHFRIAKLGVSAVDVHHNEHDCCAGQGADHALEADHLHDVHFVLVQHAFLVTIAESLENQR